MKKLGLLALIMSLIAVFAIFNLAQAQDSVWVWYGSMDGSPVEAEIGTDVEIFAYAQTSENVYGGNVTFNLAADGVYFDSLKSEVLGEWFWPFTTWDGVFFNPASSGSPLPEGWQNQAFLGFKELFPPYNGDVFRSVEPIQILKYVFSASDDSNNIGNLVPALMPGYDPFQGPSNTSDTVGTINYTVVEYASMVQFAGGGWVSGEIRNFMGQPLADVEVTCIQTNRSVLSADNGVYTIGIAPGIYDLRFFVEGYIDSTVTGVEVVLGQTTPLDFDILTSIEEEFINLIPEDFELKQNYPNPFNATTSIEYSLIETAHVRLTVYDIQGRVVEKLVDSKQEAGIHRVNWNAEELPSGMYLYRIQTGEHTQTNKMMLLK